MQAEPDGQVADKEMNTALGTEVRRARERAGLTRPELVAQLPFTIAVATLLNWELGHRAISYGRLVELARTLNTTAPELLARAIDAVYDIASLLVDVDVAPVARDPRHPVLQGWAAKKLPTLGGGTIARVHHTVVRELALLQGVPVAELVVYLKTEASLTEVRRSDQPAD